MKKRLFIFFFSLSFLVVSISVLVFFLQTNEAPSSDYANEIRVLNESFPSDIIVYGEDVGFDSTLNFRTISSITEETLTSDSKYLYTFLVINDRTGTVSITEEELELCKKFCDENNMNFYYIGEQYLDQINEICFSYGMISPNAKSAAYINAYGIQTPLHGIWNIEDEEYLESNPGLLGQILAISFVDHVIKTLN